MSVAVWSVRERQYGRRCSKLHDAEAVHTGGSGRDLYLAFTSVEGGSLERFSRRYEEEEKLHCYYLPSLLCRDNKLAKTTARNSK